MCLVCLMCPGHWLPKPGICSKALLILLRPFVQTEMGLGDMSRSTLQQTYRQARTPE